MISRYEVWINNVALSSLSSKIYVADISYQPTTISWPVSKLGMVNGQYAGSQKYIAPNRITISFEAREYDIQGRQQIIQDIIKWAGNGGWLKCSDRESQRIYVKPSKMPSISSALRWLDTLTIEFTAYDYPFWQDEEAQTQTLNNGDTGSIIITGVRETEIEALITANATLTSVSLTCGDTTIALSGISVAQGNTIRLSYSDDHHILSIVSGTTSLLDKRTTASNDDLIGVPGTNSISYTANASSTCQFMARGVYL